MPEAHRRRKPLARAPRGPVPAPSIFPDDLLSSTPPPMRPSRPTVPRPEPGDNEYDYFNAPARNDVSLMAPRARIDFPARRGVPYHWEYAAVNGLVRVRGQDDHHDNHHSGSFHPPCRECENRLRSRDFFSGPLHYACVRYLEGLARGKGGGNSPRRTENDSDLSHSGVGTREGGALDYSQASSYRCSSSSGGFSEFVNDADNMSLERPYHARAELRTREGPGNCNITRDHAYQGIDLQGIPWQNLPFSRDDYRATRLRPDVSAAGETPAVELATEPSRNVNFYSFLVNNRSVKCSIVHFQLRNLCWATSKHDVCIMNDHCIIHYDASARRKTVLLDLSGTCPADGNTMAQISTMVARDNLLIAGGFFGEIVAKNTDTGKILHNNRITFDENAITNAIDVFDNQVMASNNDSYIRCFDLETWKRVNAFLFNAPVNHATRQPAGKIVCAVGDDKLVQMLDGDSGDRIAELRGHDDFSFATAWHPDGTIFATGSQDGTCRVWDVRNMSQSLRIIGARTGPVRSVRFSADKRYMGIAEQKDFVHVYDAKNGLYDTAQEIDMFGEIAGISFTPCSETLFVAVSDRAYASLMEYQLNSSTFTRGAIP